MDRPLAGYLYYDYELHGGHYFVVGPDDPVQSNKVIVFCCTSQPHGRPDTHGCHSDHELPSYHLKSGTVSALKSRTWIQLDELYYYLISDFDTKWKYAKEKLDVSLTIDLLGCAAGSDAISVVDAEACRIEAELLDRAHQPNKGKTEKLER